MSLSNYTVIAIMIVVFIVVSIFLAQLHFALGIFT